MIAGAYSKCVFSLNNYQIVFQSGKAKVALSSYTLWKHYVSTFVTRVLH